MEAIFAAAFGFLLGIIGIGTGFSQLKNRKALELWPTTQGKVMERGTYKPGIPTRSPPAFHYSPLVKYVYHVEAQEFVNNSILPKRMQAPQINTETWAQQRADSFADDVCVHYNPTDPGESYLVLTTKTTLYVLICGGCLAMGYGLMLLVTR